jgi:tetratricopeptide (TPR) repeat protein
MKKLVLFIFLIAAQQGFAQTEQNTINKTRVLIADKKYATAYELLMHYDPANEKPAILLLKEDLALNYYLNTIMHRMFSFKDIGHNENILDLRGKKDDAEMHELPLGDIFNSLIKKHPEDYHLYKGLGEFYFAVYMAYGGNWMVPEKLLLRHIEINDSIAMEHLNSDYRTYYAMGYAYLMDQNYGEAIANLAKSVFVNPKFATAQYSLAYAYEFTHQTRKALEPAQNALALSKDTVEKADAARMIGYIYGELKDYESADKYIALSDRIEPHNYDTYKARLEMELQQNSTDIMIRTEQFYTEFIDKATIYNDLADMYTDNNKQMVLIEYFRNKITESTSNQVRTATLYFYIGRLYLSLDKSLAKANFLKAKEIFTKVYTPDNDIFKVIENNLKKTI